MINEFPLYVQELLCNHNTKFVKWKRRHKKVRINKKWRKKYGAVYEFVRCTGVCYGVGKSLVMCPCVYIALQKQTQLLEEQQNNVFGHPREGPYKRYVQDGVDAMRLCLDMTGVG